MNFNKNNINIGNINSNNFDSNMINLIIDTRYRDMNLFCFYTYYAIYPCYNIRKTIILKKVVILNLPLKEFDYFFNISLIEKIKNNYFDYLKKIEIN